MTWQPIDTAPKDGSSIWAAWPDGRVTIAWWTTNDRLAPTYSNGVPRLSPQDLAQIKDNGWQLSHFIDHPEWDDFEISKACNQPTHWMPIPVSPVKPR